MLHMCVYMHSRFVENHPIQILKDESLISEVVLSQCNPLKQNKFQNASCFLCDFFFVFLDQWIK
jgi:hypothetical protein